MKKIFAVLVCVIIIMTNCTIILAEQTEVEGLSEKLDALYIKNSFTESQLEEMKSAWKDDFVKNILNSGAPWSEYQKLHPRLLKGTTKEEGVKILCDYRAPNFDNAFLITCLNTIIYLNQYVSSNNTEYAFSNQKYWSVYDDTFYHSAYYDEDGKLIDKLSDYNSNISADPVFTEDDINFIKNKEQIEKLLLDKNENQVLDVKLLSINIMYIRCPNHEYVIKFTHYSNMYPYEICDMSKYVSEQMNRADKIKPTYEIEATALQQQGLLNGNENGLDLLKPLTRAEAAAMLIRAIGQTEATTDNTIQSFSDVPTTFWGYGATERAYSLGIINGVGNNLFKPNDNVTAKQFSTMVLRSANEPEFDWQEAVNILIEKGIITQEESSTMDFFTRGDMAKIIYEAIIKGLY